MQLQEFLASKYAAKQADGDLAERLGSVTLSQRLTSRTLSRLLENEKVVGPETAEQLALLSAASIFNSPPSEELPQSPAPDLASQRQMLAASARYVTATLYRLPDFLATRVTTHFANTPLPMPLRKSYRAKLAMHWVRESRREIAYRDGREIGIPAPSVAGAALPAPSSLTTWGEFGPILKSVFEDSSLGTIQWSRWQISEGGAQVAVFDFAVPQSASHYLVDFCCYRKSKDDPEEFSYRNKPAYHGELYVDPATGAIDCITLQADLSDDDPVTVSAIAVEYGRVDISGKDFICPVRGVAITQFHNLALKSIDKVGIEKHINLVRFLDYHKFGSTVRIVPQ